MSGLDLKLVDYSDKSVLLTGKSTYEFKEQIKAVAHCNWMISKQKNMSGWIFSKKHKPKLEKFIAEIKSKVDDLKRDIEKNPNIQGKEVVVGASSGPQRLVIAEVKKVEKKNSRAKVVVRNEKPPQPPLPTPSQILKHEYLIPAEYFQSEKDYQYWESEVVYREGWIMYLEKLFPDACPLTLTPALLKKEAGYSDEQLDEMGQHSNLDILEVMFYCAVPQFYPAEAFTTKGELAYLRSLGKLLKECQRKKKRLAIIYLKIVLEPLHSANHANAIVVDLKHGKMYRFEPNGYDFNSYFKQNDVDQAIRMAIKEDKELASVVKEYVPPVDFCPKLGPQLIEAMAMKERRADEPGGYCSAWSLLFLHTALENPKLSMSEINERMVKGMAHGDYLREKIRNYAGFIVRKRDELRKLYQRNLA